MLHSRHKDYSLIQILLNSIPFPQQFSINYITEDSYNDDLEYLSIHQISIGLFSLDVQKKAVNNIQKLFGQLYR